MGTKPKTNRGEPGCRILILAMVCTLISLVLPLLVLSSKMINISEVTMFPYFIGCVVAVFVFASLYGWSFEESKEIPCKRALNSLLKARLNVDHSLALTAGSVECQGKRYYLKRWYGMPTLDLRNMGIRDLAEVHGLADCAGLQALRLDHNDLAQLRGLENIQSIRVLILRKNHLGRNLAGGLLPPVLEFLDLSSNGLEDVAQLGHLPNLRVLDLTGNKIVEITNLENLPKLRVLDAWDNPMKKIGNLAHQSLEVLHLGDNPIKSIASNIHLPHIRQLNIGSWIVGIPGISGLPSLATFLNRKNALEQRIFLPFVIFMLFIIITSLFLVPSVLDFIASIFILIAFLPLRPPSQWSLKLIQKSLSC